jgi:molybdate transport system substrate-binding protein
MQRVSRFILAGLAVLCLAAPLLANAAVPIVAAASDLKFALEEVAAAFQQDSGQSVTLNFGSSGNFVTQIRNGAPFTLFLSADEEYVNSLKSEGLTKGDGALYAEGHIVLMVPRDSDMPVDGELKGLAAYLKAGKISRFAIASPEHAPYGKRAEEALRHAGLWEAIKSKLVLGENVSQAAQFAVGGSTQGGIVALSLAKAPQMSSLARYALISVEWHRPLRQRMVLLKNADAATEAFYRYLQQPSARDILSRYGFLPPEDKR